MTAIRLQDLPVFPLYDEMSVHRGHTLEQIEWLLENGSLYAYQARKGPLCTYLEITKHQGKYYYILYDPEYRGDCHNPDLVTIREYPGLLTLLDAERISGLADRAPLPGEERYWHWTDYTCTLLSNGGSFPGGDT